MLAIGLMSGTSLDGVDAALVETDNFKLIEFITLKYDEKIKSKIARNLNNETARLSEISTLNFEISNYFVRAIDELLKKAHIKHEDVDFIASHGQTIWHDPNGSVASTLQIGEPAVIYYKTKIPVISNFRAMDVAAGGQGAPLVPFSEWVLYRSKTQNIVMQNIGGISNLTYLKKEGKLDEVLSFDVGPGNVMIDYFTNKYFNKPYDENGDIANSGKVIDEVLEFLKSDEFLSDAPPKSTGREKYNKAFMEKLSLDFDFEHKNKEDIITTITEFTSFAITYNYKRFLKDVDLAIINGGGAHNKYIMRRLKEENDFKVITGEDFGINSDAKEALAFVVLGYMSLQGKPSNVRSATGASDYVVLGSITGGKCDWFKKDNNRDKK